jgi:hypothetical protein
VGNVMDLYARGKLCRICGLGRSRFSEIDAALVFVGLNLGRCQQPPAGAEGATR